MGITTKEALKLSILKLEEKEFEQKKNLLLQLTQIRESIKPVNLIKGAFNDITSGPGLAGKVLNATLGIGAGILSKKMMIGPSHNILNKLVGSALELGVAGMVAKNGQQIKSGIGGLFKKLLSKRTPRSTNEKILIQ